MRKAKSKKIFVIEQIVTLDPLLPGQQVWMLGRRNSGVIVAELLYLLDHNYIVSTSMGEMRRNRQHLTKILDSENSDSRPEQTP